MASSIPQLKDKIETNTTTTDMTESGEGQRPSLYVIAPDYDSAQF